MRDLEALTYLSRIEWPNMESGYSHRGYYGPDSLAEGDPFANLADRSFHIECILLSAQVFGLR